MIGQLHSQAAAALFMIFACVSMQQASAFCYSRPTKLTRMSFDVAAYPAVFFEMTRTIKHFHSDADMFALLQSRDFRPFAEAKRRADAPTDEDGSGPRKARRLRGGLRRSSLE
jgi:hypothetical protein